MKNEKLRLLESLSNPGWQFNEEYGWVEMMNFDGTRRLEYRDWGDGYGGVMVTLSLHFLNEAGGWSEAMSVSFLTTDEGEEKMGICVDTRRTDEKKAPWDPMVYFDESGNRLVRGSSSALFPAKGRTLEDRNELLLRYDEVPEVIDLPLTVQIFIDQMIKGEMGRPVLVPKGLITLEEPTEGIPSAVARAINIDRATTLLAKAKTRVEKEVARAVYGWVVGQ